MPGTNLLFEPPKAIESGRKVVAAAGTREALVAKATTAKYVIITAETDNTGVMAIGDATVIAALATRVGTPLMAGESVFMPATDLANVYIDATVTTDGVTFTYFN